MFEGDRRARAKFGIVFGVCTIVLALGMLLFDDQSSGDAVFYILLGIGAVAVCWLLLKKRSK